MAMPVPTQPLMSCHWHRWH